MQIVELSGLSYSTVRSAINHDEEGGFAALKSAARCKQPGDCRELTPEQKAEIQRLICDKRPEQLKMIFALWSRSAALQLIEQACGIKMSIR